MFESKSQLKPDVVELERSAVNEYLQQAEVMLGAGNFAKVITRAGDSFCVKDFKPEIVFDYTKDELFNEFTIQEKVARLGGRVPRPIGHFYNKTQGRYNIYMETIPGNSLDDFRKGKAELPKEFDFDAFFADARQKVAQIHAFGIVHGDLNIGNIMRDTTTGEAVIIDFGQSRDIQLKEGQEMSEMTAQEDFDELYRTRELFREWLVQQTA